MNDFTKTHARSTDPSTSHEAAARAVVLLKAHHQMIAARLKAIHPHGETVDELSRATGLGKDAVFRRITELGRTKIARAEGLRRMATGRNGRVWYWTGL